ncbi:MAG TPA: HEPN domain-containing protein [Candidatus Hydrogenedentes bacterium]|nr:HEPN domain-containing protein [Candidatus Hydrogenedentota bacterium]
MKDKADLVRGWLKKAESDLTAMNASFHAGALDAACFHAQQAVEKCLKAFLIFHSIDFPYTHNLSKLVEHCITIDPSFGEIVSLVEPLTPYAVETRYDYEFWPATATVSDAQSTALNIYQFVKERLPGSILPG